MTQTSNPLGRFFRQPAIYIRLPSQGRGWPPGSIDMPQSGELPVFPMTVIDDITYRTPDALFNGEAIVSVIQSCVPNIRDAWAVPSSDLDTILIGIRIASTGHSMDISTTCPECNTDSDFGLDLRTVLDKMTTPDYSKPLQLGEMVIHFKPLDYREITESNQKQFEQQKGLQAIAENDDADTRSEIINKMMKQIVEVTVQTVSRSISSIRIEGAVVTDFQQINEFLNNCDREIFARIRDQAVKLRESTELKPLRITCPNCQHQYDQPFTLDMARFFDSAS